MPQLVDISVVRALHDAILARRYVRLHALRCRLLDDCIAVVSSAPPLVLSGKSFDQRTRLCAIRNGT